MYNYVYNMELETAQQIGRALVPIIVLWLGYRAGKKYYDKKKGGAKK